MKPTVSIVVPAYNNAAYIAETMHSILNQSYSDLEIVVADHSSTDETWTILQSFAADPRVTLLQTEAGGGARRNWNRVTEAATGEFVKLVCGDDLIAPTMVERQLAAFEDGVVLVASTRDVVDADLRPIVRNWGLGGLKGRRSGTAAIRRTVRSGRNIFGEPACVMMRRDALVSAGLWADEQYLIDQATYTAVLRKGDFVAVPESLASFRVSADQWSVRLAAEQSQQVVRFHDALHASDPDIVSRFDVSLGNVRARLSASARRLTYSLLGRRMRKASK